MALLLNRDRAARMNDIGGRVAWSAGTVFGPLGALRVAVGSSRRRSSAADIAAIDRGENRTMFCWFRGLYGDYPRRFDFCVLYLTPDGLVCRRKYPLVTGRRRHPIGGRIISVTFRPPDSRQETLRIGTGGLYAAGGPLEQAGKSMVRCETEHGILEFAVKPVDAALLQHYLHRMGHKPAAP